MIGVSLINEQEIQQKKNGVDLWTDLNKDLSQDDIQKRFLENYWLLTKYPEYFKNLSPLMIFYNLFYWFQRFYNRYLTIHTNDYLNMQQYHSKIIEEGDWVSGIDWSVIEQMMIDSKSLQVDSASKLKGG